MGSETSSESSTESFGSDAKHLVQRHNTKTRQPSPPSRKGKQTADIRLQKPKISLLRGSCVKICRGPRSPRLPCADTDSDSDVPSTANLNVYDGTVNKYTNTTSGRPPHRRCRRGDAQPSSSTFFGNRADELPPSLSGSSEEEFGNRRISRELQSRCDSFDWPRSGSVDRDSRLEHARPDVPFGIECCVPLIIILVFVLVPTAILALVGIAGSALS